jgi:hypothetical protein
MEKTINEYRILFGVPEVRRALGKSRCRLQDNIKAYLKGTRSILEELRTI